METKVGDDYARALEPESAGKMKKGAIAGFVFGFSQMAIFVSFAVVFFSGKWISCFPLHHTFACIFLTSTIKKCFIELLSGAQMLSSFDISFVDFFTSVLAVMFGALGSSQVSADFNSRQRGKIAAAR